MRLNAYEDRMLLPCQCFLDGVDVSRDCFEADDVEGYVLVYVRDDLGRITIQDGWPAWERREGYVVLVPRRKARKGA